ncbi:hypothetical protein C8J57DRAFT_1065816 [Mycena rebaudengoi]|nr:hypothetical protein C8J57DRAFT_1065816 [Mycena rebaudengoi]
MGLGSLTERAQDKSLHEWIFKRDEYLSIFMECEGCAGVDLTCCPDCHRMDMPNSLRCHDCFGGLMYCQECMVSHHRCSPLHRIYRWDRLRFLKTSLAVLGLCVQLGHPPGTSCTAPEEGKTGFVVLHTNRIHEVAVEFCSCEGALYVGSPEQQLLRTRWFT